MMPLCLEASHPSSLNREVHLQRQLRGSMARVVAHLYGKTKNQFCKGLISDYETRMEGRGVTVKHHSEKSKTPKEYEKYLIELSGALILLDENGKLQTSNDFSSMCEQLILGSKTVNFAIGPADGFSEEIKMAAPHILSLSKMTMPHELATVVFLEQLYRTTEILRGSPYHRD